MGSDLHASLGKGRPPKRKGPRGRFFLVVSGAVVCCGLAAFAIYAARDHDGLKQVAANAESGQGGAAAPADQPATAPPSRTTSTYSSGNSGANVVRTQTGDGNYVTKYTPRDREGPAIVNAQRIGQDLLVAGVPNPDLVEDSDFGSLPVVAPDGLRPMEQYARPWSGARGTRVAIVISGLGLSQTGSQRAIQQLPAGVTLAFAASGNSLQRWTQEARRKGHEILLQVPFEPFDYPANDPGPTTLLTVSSPQENLSRLHQAMGEITNYTGIMSYQGGRYLADEKAMRPIFQEIAARGLLFLDDGTSSVSKSGTVAGAAKLPHTFADVVLDGQLDKDAILKKLDELGRIADRKGVAVGVASAFDESVDAVKAWSEQAAQRGIEIVGVSAIVRDDIQQ